MSDLKSIQALQKFGIASLDLEDRYVLLEQMKAECDSYLEYGNRNAMCMWAKDEDAQVDCMMALWESLPDGGKPDWLNNHDIDRYGSYMTGLLARIFYAYDNQWAPSEELLAEAKAYREANPGLTFENSGWKGCRFSFHHIDGGADVQISLEILPECYVGHACVTGLTMDERMFAYQVLDSLGYLARDYGIESVEMIGDGWEIDREKAYLRLPVALDDLPLDDMLREAQRIAELENEPKKDDPEKEHDEPWRGFEIT